MLPKKDIVWARTGAAVLLRKAGIAMSRSELARMEVVDCGLGDIRHTGLEIVVYENNVRYCAKELILLPGQTCPEHRHPPVAGQPGKRETFRCRWGRVILCVPGIPSRPRRARPPRGTERFYTVRREIVLLPGDQYTVPPNTLHWFQPGRRGAVVSEFSSTSRDGSDRFTDPHIRR